MPSIFNPTQLQFTASSDHDTLLFDGSAKLTDYLAEYVGDGAPPTASLGKPTPVGGLITVPLPTFTDVGPYLARVGAHGPGGTTWTEGSDPFGFAEPPTPPPTPPTPTTPATPASVESLRC